MCAARARPPMYALRLAVSPAGPPPPPLFERQGERGGPGAASIGFFWRLRHYPCLLVPCGNCACACPMPLPRRVPRAMTVVVAALRCGLAAVLSLLLLSQPSTPFSVVWASREELSNGACSRNNGGGISSRPGGIATRPLVGAHSRAKRGYVCGGCVAPQAGASTTIATHRLGRPSCPLCASGRAVLAVLGGWPRP